MLFRSGAVGIAVVADDLGSAPTNAPWVDTTASQRLLSFQKHTVEDLERECYERFKLLRPFVRPLSPLIMRAVRLYLRPARSAGSRAAPSGHPG